MSGDALKLLELLLVVGVVFGFVGQQILSLRRGAQEDSRRGASRGASGPDQKRLS